MLKPFCPNLLLVVNMSQKKISSFFTKPQGQKRPSDEQIQKGSPKCPRLSDEFDVTTEENLAYRASIATLAKDNPALSANIGLSWFRALADEFQKDYFKELGEFIRKERAKYTIYPPEKEVYFWTNTVKINLVNVVILGQDPYHGPNQAHGLAFSVRKGVTVPPSLKNIYKELANDIPGFTIPSHGYLYGWATQGVLLLNATLTVRAGQANSHSSSKWSCLTDAVIRWINKNLPNCVFMLWGKNAQEKLPLITKNDHLVLTASHPSPFSADRGFFGCRHFSKANDYLSKNGRHTIDWNHLP